MFRLTQQAIDAIIQTPGLKLKLGLAISRSENSIHRLVRENQVNGALTKEAALLVIQKETKLSRKNILEVMPVMQT